jgi:GntR family transcriptional repressor for pyruvate dehydrogenase complex
VAAHLREQILSGGMRDGSELPAQDRLVDELRLSRQAVREGLHILELEGLVTIRRGNVGGAVVHLPSPIDAAYNFALVIQARGARLEDVGTALTKLEPVCVGLCAQRADRMETVVPHLRMAREDSVASITDLSAWLESQSLFHRILASDCGNEALAVLAGALEAVWLAHVREWAEGFARVGAFPDAADRLECPGVADHDVIVALIEQGDAERAVLFARHHMEAFYAQLSDFDSMIKATTLTHRFG